MHLFTIFCVFVFITLTYSHNVEKTSDKKSDSVKKSYNFESPEFKQHIQSRMARLKQPTKSVDLKTRQNIPESISFIQELLGKTIERKEEAENSNEEVDEDTFPADLGNLWRLDDISSLSPGLVALPDVYVAPYESPPIGSDKVGIEMSELTEETGSIRDTQLEGTYYPNLPMDGHIIMDDTEFEPVIDENGDPFSADIDPHAMDGMFGNTKLDEFIVDDTILANTESILYGDIYTMNITEETTTNAIPGDITTTSVFDENLANNKLDEFMVGNNDTVLADSESITYANIDTIDATEETTTNAITEDITTSVLEDFSSTIPNIEETTTTQSNETKEKEKVNSTMTITNRNEKEVATNNRKNKSLLA